MKCETTEFSELKQKLEAETLKELDLRNFDFRKHPVDFSGKQLENVDFSNNKTLEDISFKKAKLIHCSFRDSKIYACDFRYADIMNSSFQGAKFKYVDFYRAAFRGITVFQDAKIESSSLNYVSFETFSITRDNLQEVKSRGFVGSQKHYLPQEDEGVWRDFWGKWKRIDSLGKDKSDKQKESLDLRYKEAEKIYRQLSALWESKGYSRDAEWAYLQAKRMERKYLWHAKIPAKKCKQNNEGEAFYVCLWLEKLMRRFKACLNFMADMFLGYGVSLPKVILSYLVLIIIFGFVYNHKLDEASLGTCMKLSMSKTIGASHSIDLKNTSLEILSFLQTGLGMLLTGFLGFVVANKIRKS